MNLFSQGKTSNWNKIGIKVEYETARKDKNIGVRWKVTWSIDRLWFYGYNIVTTILMQGQTKSNLTVKKSFPNKGSGVTYFPNNTDYYWFADGYADNVIENCKLNFFSTNGGIATYSTDTKNITAPVRVCSEQH